MIDNNDKLTTELYILLMEFVDRHNIKYININAGTNFMITNYK